MVLTRGPEIHGPPQAIATFDHGNPENEGLTLESLVIPYRLGSDEQIRKL